MGAYEMGLADDMGLVKYGIKETGEQLRLTDTFMNATNSDVAKSKANAAFKEKWGKLYSDWKRFFNNVGSKWNLTAKLRDTTYDRAVLFHEQAEKYRDGLISIKAVVTPSSQVQATNKVRRFDGSVALNVNGPTVGIPWKWIVGGVAVIGLGYGAYRYVTAPKRAAKRVIDAAMPHPQTGELE